MNRLIKKDSFYEFVEYNRAFIENDIMLHIYLINTIQKIESVPNLLINYFNIVKGNKTIIVLHIKNVCLIYGDLNDDDSILFLGKELKFKELYPFNFAGNREIIHKLLNLNNSKFLEIKYLSIYKCTKVNESIHYDESKIKLLNKSDLNTLKEFLKEFHAEFYNGYSEDLIPNDDVLMKGILENNYYKFLEDNKIKAIGSVFNQYGYPELKFVHTKKEYRNNKIATHLSTSITSKVLIDYNYIMLYTKGNNFSAKKVFENIGYTMTGEYTMFFKEE